MGELERKIEQKAVALMQGKKDINEMFDEKVTQANDVNSAIDFHATQTALKQEETLAKVVEEKQEELRNIAEAKRVQAETERLQKEVAKVRQEKEKQLAELDKAIYSKQKEVEQLKADGDKEKAFFENNKDILKYIGIREKKTLRTMQILMIPATTIFMIVQILLFPLTFIGLLLETIVNIIGGICGEIKNHAIKIIVSILVIGVLVAGCLGAYYYGGKIFL